MRPVTPRGFRDVLPVEALRRESVRSSIGGRLASWGYVPVETPAVELLATLEAAGDLEGTAFRLFDSDGRLLALRPDMTLPIARLVASRFDSGEGPFRLRYDAPVFREHESLRGQARQFTQIGVEFVGESGPSADAEVVALLVEALVSAGLENFSVSLGTVAVLRALLEASGRDEPWCARVLDAVHTRNVVALGALAREEGVSDRVRRALPLLLRIRGGREAIDECRELVAGVGCDDALDALDATWSLLEAVGAQRFAQVDFSVMRSFDYYTGVVFEAYAPGLGVSLGGGGRYDGALASFDRPTPAAGFALGLERVLIALASQGADDAGRQVEAVVGGSDPEVAFRAAAGLRDEGVVVELCSGTRTDLEARASRVGARALWADDAAGEDR